MWLFETKVSEIILRTPSIRSFRFPIDTPGFRYKPGQFFFVTIKTPSGEGQHHISFSSSPTEKGRVEFTKRITQSEFSQSLARMNPGDWAKIYGPSGDFTLPGTPRKLAFLSGGIGITPLRSMLRFIDDKGLNFDVVLLYSNASHEEIAFREELDRIATDNKRVRVVHVLSAAPEGWKGRTGLINGALVSEEIPDFKDRLFYLSGPPKMVLALDAQLTELGVPPRKIKRDSFTGYD